MKTSISVPGEDFEPFREWCGKHSRIQGDMLGRVLRWFVKQRPIVWRSIVDDLDEDDLRPAMASILRSLADEIESKPLAEQQPDPGSGVVIEHGRITPAKVQQH